MRRGSALGVHLRSLGQCVLRLQVIRPIRAFTIPAEASHHETFKSTNVLEGAEGRF